MGEVQNRKFLDYFWEEYAHPLLVPPCLLTFFVLIYGWISEDVTRTEWLTTSGMCLGVLIILLFGLPALFYRIDHRKGDHDAIAAHLHEMGRPVISGERPSSTADARLDDMTLRERARLAARYGQSSQNPQSLHPRNDAPDPLNAMLQRLLRLQEQWRSSQNLRPRMKSHAQITLALEVLIQAHRDALAIPPNAEARQRIVPELDASMVSVLGLMQSDIDATSEHRADDVLASLRALRRQTAQR
jgi:hypothetical protein